MHYGLQAIIISTVIGLLGRKLFAGTSPFRRSRRSAPLSSLDLPFRALASLSAGLR
jgi:hypothetical protein